MSMNFRDALLRAIESHEVSLRSVATGSGVSYEQLKKLKQRPDASTNIDDAVRIAGYFGQTLDQFLQEPDGSAPHHVTEIYTKLSERDRQRLLFFARGLRDSQD